MRGRPERAIYVPPSQRHREAPNGQSGANEEPPKNAKEQNTEDRLAELSLGPSRGGGVTSETTSSPGRVIHAWETAEKSSPSSKTPIQSKESTPRRRNQSASSSSRKPPQKASTSPGRPEGARITSPSRESPSSTLKVSLRRSVPTNDHPLPIPLTAAISKSDRSSPKPQKSQGSKGKSGTSYKDSMVIEVKKSQKDPDPPIRFVPAKALITDASWADEEDFDYTQVPKF